MKLFNKCIYLLIICFGFMSFVSAKELNKKELITIDNSIVLDTIETSEGNYVGVGGAMLTEKNAWPFPAHYMVKFDSSGKIIWEYRDDEIFSLLLDVGETSDGGYAAVGYSYDPSVYSIVKLDEDGNVVWSEKGRASVEGVRGSVISSYSDMVIDGDDIIAIGYNTATYYDNGGQNSTYSGGVIAKYSNDGKVLWKKELFLTYTYNFNDLIVLEDGTYLVVGNYKSLTANGDLPATSNSCGLLVNYSKDGEVLSETAVCNENENIAFNHVLEIDNKYFVGAVVDKKDYVYVYDEKLNYHSNVKISDSVDSTAYFYSLDGCIVVLEFIDDEKSIIYYYDEEFNVLFSEEVFFAYNSKGVHFRETLSGDLIINDNLANSESTNASEIYDSKIFLYNVLFDVKVEKSENGIVDWKQEGNFGKITVVPDEGYVLGEIKIIDSNGNTVDYYEEDGYYYFEMNDDVTVNVTYELKEESSSEDVEDETKEDNPETNDISLSMIIILISAIAIYIVSYKGLKKKSI